MMHRVAVVRAITPHPLHSKVCQVNRLQTMLHLANASDLHCGVTLANISIISTHRVI